MILFSGVALLIFERMLTDEITSTSVLSSISISLLFLNHVRIQQCMLLYVEMFLLCFRLLMD